MLTVVAPCSFQSYVAAEVESCVAAPTRTSNLVWVSTQWPAVSTTFGAMSVAEQRYEPVAVASTDGAHDRVIRRAGVLLGRGRAGATTTVPAKTHIQTAFFTGAPLLSRTADGADL